MAAALPDKPFNDVLAGKRFRLMPEDGWYCVNCLDVRGVATQGRTFEEACYMALDALQLMESCEKDPWPDEFDGVDQLSEMERLRNHLAFGIWADREDMRDVEA